MCIIAIHFSLLLDRTYNWLCPAFTRLSVICRFFQGSFYQPIAFKSKTKCAIRAIFACKRFPIFIRFDWKLLQFFCIFDLYWFLQALFDTCLRREALTVGSFLSFWIASNLRQLLRELVLTEFESFPILRMLVSWYSKVNSVLPERQLFKQRKTLRILCYKGISESFHL